MIIFVHCAIMLLHCLQAVAKVYVGGRVVNALDRKVWQTNVPLLCLV